MVSVLHARGVLVAFATVVSLSEFVLSVDTSDGGHSDEVASERTVGGVSESCTNDCIWTTGLHHDQLFGNRRVGSDANREAVWWSAQTDVNGGVHCIWNGVPIRDGHSLLMSDLLSWLKSRDIDVPWRCDLGPEEPYGHSSDLSRRLSTNDVMGLSFDVRRAVSIALDKAALTKGKRAKDYASSDSYQCTANPVSINDSRERQRLLEEELRELTSRLEETQMLYENALKSLAKMPNQGGIYTPGSTLKMNTDDMDHVSDQPASSNTAKCLTGSDHGNSAALNSEQPDDVLRIIDSHDADVNAVDRARPEPVKHSPFKAVRDGITILSSCVVELLRWIFAALRVHVFEHVPHASRNFDPHDLNAHLVLSFEKLVKDMDSIIGVQVLSSRKNIETIAYVTLLILLFAFMSLLRWTVRLLRISSKSKSRSEIRAEETVNKQFRLRAHERRAEGRPEDKTSVTSEMVNTTRNSQFGSEVDRNMKAQPWREMNSTTGAEVEWKNISVPSPVGEQGQVEEQRTGMSSQVMSTALKHDATFVPQMRRGPPPRVNTNLMNVNPAYESIAWWN
jgi:hypothetical protein